MRIKKSSSGNEYVRAGDAWVRNFTKQGVASSGLTLLYAQEDFETLLANEIKNKNYPRISDEPIEMDNVVIVSDGFNFEWKHLAIAKFPSNVHILVINRALKNWKLMSRQLDDSMKRPINAYVINNPFQEAMSYLPSVHNPYFPTCVASSRTHYQFLQKYSGNKYVYEPMPLEVFGTEKQESYFIDDYRNPICAAIGLAYRFGVKKLMLISCDDSFKEQKDFAEQLPNGLWTYPQHLRAQEIIDANLYWLKYQEEREIQVADWSDGMKHHNAVYINNEEDAISFFTEEGTS